MRKSLSGFTIVELLIVIVVIAILAAIAIVAYTGIQNSGNDSAVQSDLSKLKKKVELFYAENSYYPVSNNAMLSLEFKATTSAYQTHSVDYNLLYCQPWSVSTQQYSIVALSKSGSIFWTSNEIGGIEKYTGIWQEDQADICEDTGSPAGTGHNNVRGFAPDDEVNGPWRPWVGGN